MWTQRVLRERQADAACDHLRLQTEFFVTLIFASHLVLFFKQSMLVHSMNAAARSVIFDYDGTLVDTAGAFLDSVNRALGNADLRSATRKEISSMDLRSIGERVHEVGSSESVDDVFDSIWEAFADTLSSPFPLREGADEVLNELANQRIGLLSYRRGEAEQVPYL
jgi:hypothetical protein